MNKLKQQVRREKHPGVSSELCIQNNEDYPHDYSLNAISLVSNAECDECELSYLGYPYTFHFTVPDDFIDFTKLPLDSKF